VIFIAKYGKYELQCRPEVAEHVFWAAVTPAGGEVAPLD
jgi:hypothetical protein